MHGMQLNSIHFIISQIGAPVTGLPADWAARADNANGLICWTPWMRRSNHNCGMNLPWSWKSCSRKSVSSHSFIRWLSLTGSLVQNQPNMKMLTASITITESALSLIEDKDYNSNQSSNDSNLRNPPGSSNPTLERQKTLDQKQISTSSRKWISTLLIEPSRSKFKSTWKQQSDIRTGAVMHQKTNFDLITWINIDAIQQNAADHRIDRSNWELLKRI